MVYRQTIKHLGITRIIAVIGASIVESLLAIFGVSLLIPIVGLLYQDPDQVSEQISTRFPLLNDIINGTNLDLSFFTLSIAACSIIVLQQIAKGLKDLLIVKLSNELTLKLRKYTLLSYFSTKPDFFDEFKLGSAESVAVVEAIRAGGIISFGLGAISALVLGLAYTLAMVLISWQLTLVFTVSLLMILMIAKIFRRLLENDSKKLTIANKDLHSFLSEKVRAYSKLILCGTRRSEIQVFQQKCRDVKNLNVSIQKKSIILNTILEPLNFITILVMVFIGFKVFGLDYSLITVYLYSAMRASPQFKVFANSSNQVSVYEQSLLSINSAIASAKMSRETAGGKKALTSIDSGIELEKVFFSYGDKEIFKNLNLRFPKNQTTVIVGSSGRGKSTLLKLILKLIRPNKGTVKIDSTDINCYLESDLRREIAFLPQEHILFHGSIRENLTYGLSSVSEKDIFGALKETGLVLLIESLPMGLDTSIGDEGRWLSGGQKQRLLLTRVFLQNPSIIIMDEPTSSLDEGSEKIVLDSLKKLKHTKTIVLTSHKKQLLELADKIIDLDTGNRNAFNQEKSS